MRKGFLELCVLTLVDKKERAYGFEILASLVDCGLDVSEGTLYPLLARLFSERKLTPEWETPETGHPRKFYRVSPSGSTALSAMAGEYENQHAAYTRLKGGSR
jgi:PadR family transcriptional regulator PadR